jgi:hypothetical protein
MAVLRQGSPYLFDETTGDIVGVKMPDGEDVLFANKDGARGNPGKLYNLICGTFRKDLAIGPVWAGIFDSAHKPSLMTEPEEVSTELKLNYNTGDNLDIGTMIVVPDENFARAGFSFGASTNKDFANVSGGGPCDFLVDLTNPALASLPITKDSRAFGDQRFSASVAASGLITIQHPQVQSKQYPNVQFRAPTSAYPYVVPHYMNLAAPGQTTLFLVARLAGRTSWNGSTWGTAFSQSSPFNALVTANTYNPTTGELTITHPTCTDNSIPALTDYTVSGTADSYHVTLVGSNSTTFIVRFRKMSDDSIPAAIPTGVGFTFDRGQSAILPRDCLAGAISVDLSEVQVDMRDVNWPNANIWVMGMMGKAKTT